MTRQRYRAILRDHNVNEGMRAILRFLHDALGLSALTNLEHCFLCEAPVELPQCAIGIFWPQTAYATRLVRWALQKPHRKPTVGYSICHDCIVPDVTVAVEQRLFAMGRLNMLAAGLTPPSQVHDSEHTPPYDFVTWISSTVAPIPFEPEDIDAWFGRPIGEPS
jgi:hypothetical protein